MCCFGIFMAIQDGLPFRDHDAIPHHVTHPNLIYTLKLYCYCLNALKVTVGANSIPYLSLKYRVTTFPMNLEMSKLTSVIFIFQALAVTGYVAAIGKTVIKQIICTKQNISKMPLHIILKQPAVKT